jgi:hypothetical protein
MSLRDFLVIDFSDITNWIALLVAAAMFFFTYWITFK